MKYSRKAEIIRQYELRKKTPPILGKTYSRSNASDFLKDRAKEFDFSKRYDVFLSHAYADPRVVRQVRKLLIDNGLSVYVDWIEDNQLSRSRMSSYTAYSLRNRMNHCESLIYLTSEAAEKSVWMPWELGYMDAKTERVAIAPIIDDEDADFPGREYLGIYPSISISDDTMFVYQSDGKFKSVEAWRRNTYDWLELSS